MRKRTTRVIVAIVILALLAVGTTAGAMALTHNGYTGGMMNGQQGYQGMMGSYQQTPDIQGTTVTGSSHMTMQNFAYQMSHIQVRAGTTVTWANQDSAPHSVTFKNGMMGSGLLSQGQSYSYTFNTPGTYPYFCTVHPSMSAIVTVVP